MLNKMQKMFRKLLDNPIIKTAFCVIAALLLALAVLLVAPRGKRTLKDSPAAAQNEGLSADAGEGGVSSAQNPGEDAIPAGIAPETEAAESLPAAESAAEIPAATPAPGSGEVRITVSAAGDVTL